MRYYITGVPDPGAFKVETRDALNQLEFDSRPFLAQATNRPSQAVKDSNDVYYSGKAVTTQVNHGSSIHQYRDFLNPTRRPTVMSTNKNTIQIVTLLQKLQFARQLRTELCRIVPAKLWELSGNFPKLADWLCIGWPSCLAALRREISNMQE